ncbi:beta-ketoacyl-ACP synthase [Rhizobium sp. L1K21]|uniref:beta-ketoacyl-ACP synthase n=1 Tax=Rhizobium sp. L1K21 TaxID=2954933 RepID=UPI0020929FB1|nr:beta-ketoacyl-ACP synthase [Rhizobium sp. L1K21]MCO6185809.1 beta-ketoacyl-ACP synthase [Rhizobium sp. L1K21]
MANSSSDVVITGVGIVSCLGVGREAHEEALFSTTAPTVRVETERFAPYPVHPLPEIDWSAQIPKRGDQRQMENWQRLGVFAAGLALDDAGMKDNAELCSTMDMIVAASGGERDIHVDSMIADEALTRNDREELLNEKLTTELRPTLFLAQLSNLLAGNISIVHKVTGSSRTFMGEEGAGVSAVETAAARIRAGESTHALVGGALNAERPDILLQVEGSNCHATGGWTPLWSRDPNAGGGMMLGSLGAFLVLESRAHAEARGASIYAVLENVEGDRGTRDDGKMESRLDRMAEGLETALVFSGATGMHGLTGREKSWIEKRFPNAALRGFGGALGHGMEAQFPAGLALAALALGKGAKVVPLDADNEAAMNEPVKNAVVTTVGHQRGEGIAYLTQYN